MTTSEKLLANHSYLFPRVEVIDTLDVMPKNVTVNDWEKKAIVIHDDVNGGFHIGGYASEKYQLTKNEETFLPVADKLDSLFGAENINIRVKASKPFEYFVYFEMPNLATSEMDALYPMYLKANSYTTQVKDFLQGMIGRIICSNGMMTIAESMLVYSAKHTKKETEILLNIDDILKGVETVAENFGLMTNHRDVMNSISLDAVTTGENTFERFESLTKGTLFPKKQIETAFNIAQKEAAMLKQNVTLWLAYNAFNHVLWHDNSFKMTEKVRNEQDAKLVNKIHNLSLSMA